MVVKVITYGTYDLLHEGHIKLLERAKALGDYLIVAVTSDDFDKARGKINVVQPLDVRMENVRKTGLADRIIVEEYEGQKIDDIQRYDIDIFTVGSDWIGKFDYLEKYCKVIYLERTPNISSSSLRSEAHIKLGFVGEFTPISKYIGECSFINGIDAIGIFSDNEEVIEYASKNNISRYDSYHELLKDVDAVLIISDPHFHYSQIKEALFNGVHVICHSPISLNCQQYKELIALASQNNLLLMDAIKTAYSIAYNRMCLLLEGNVIGDVVNIKSTCTSIRSERFDGWNSICMWGPVALLPVFAIMGPDPSEVQIISKRNDGSTEDSFVFINLRYKNSIANIVVGDGIKSESDLVISGTKGYIYVPSPWWKLEYFEIRFENQSSNRRYYYELMGEGIRLMLSTFLKNIQSRRNCIDDYSLPIVKIMELYEEGKIIKLE